MSVPSLSAAENGVAWPIGLVETVHTPEIDPRVTLEDPSLIKMIKSAKVGDFVLDERFLPGISRLTTSAQFIEIAEHGKTREASGREVAFGQLLLNSDDDGEHTLHVAIKPFFKNEPEQTAHEYSVASYFAGGAVQGIDTFRPLGIYRTSETQQAVISHYRHSVRSLDTVLWRPERINDRLMVPKALGRVGVTLATIHNHGWTHGDAQPKNFGWDITKPVSDTFIIDVETAAPFSTDQQGNVIKADAEEEVMADIERFIATCYQLKDEGHEIPEDYSDLIKQNFCLVYAETRQFENRGEEAKLFERMSEFVVQQAAFGMA